MRTTTIQHYFILETKKCKISILKTNKTIEMLAPMETASRKHAPLSPVPRPRKIDMEVEKGLMNTFARETLESGGRVRILIMLQ